MRAAARAVAAVGARPRCWPEAWRVVGGLVPRRGRGLRGVLRWLAFRMETAYGDPAAFPPPAELVAYLEWSAEERRALRRVRIAGGRAR